MKKRKPVGTGKLGPSDELTKAIQDTRVHNGYSQHAFARHFNRDYVSVWRWESGTRVPHRSVLREMLKIAPVKHRRTFEKYLGKTLDLVLNEEYFAVSMQGHELNPDWAAEPERHLEGIYTALTDRINLLWRQATIGNEMSAHSLMRMLETVNRELEGADESHSA